MYPAQSVDALAMDQAATGQLRLMRPLPLQAAMALGALHGDEPYADVEQILIEDLPALAPLALLQHEIALCAKAHQGLQLRIHLAPSGELLWLHDPALLPEVVAIDLPDQAAFDAFVAQDRLRGLDLRQGPGWRVTQISGAGRAALLVTAHHAILDLVGMENLVAELFDPASAKGPGEIGQIGDYLQGITEGALDPQQLLARLADARHLGLPQLAGAGDAPPQRRARLTRDVPAAITRALTKRAALGGANLFVALQAAFGLLLARHSGADEAVFGLTLSGRGALPGHRHTIASLIATLPQRIVMRDQPDLDQLLSRVMADSLSLRALHGIDPAALTGAATDALAGLDLPRPEAVLVYNPQSLAERLAARSPYWQGRRIRLLEEGRAPLTLAITGQQSLVIEWEYDPARYDGQLIAALADRYVALVSAMARAPNRAALASLDMLTPQESAQLQRLARPDRDWQIGQVGNVPQDLWTAIAQRASASPRAIALRPLAAAGPGSFAPIPYAELVQRVDALASKITALAARGTTAAKPKGAAGPPATGKGLIALCQGRGPDHVIAMLACLAAGHAFVPLPPGLAPKALAERLEGLDLLAQIGPKAHPLITAPWLDPSAAAPPNAAARPGEGAAPPGDPDALAYLIHTSGTTGRPKAVMGRRAALLAHARAVQLAYQLTPADRVLQFASPGFDVLLEETFPTLLAGACLVIAPPEGVQSLSGFVQDLGRAKVNLANLPASFWHSLTRHLAEAHPPRTNGRPQKGKAAPLALRLLVTGSERVDPGALAEWQRLFAHCEWINAYGPTEATISALAYRLAPGTSWQGQGDVPIGRPLGHAAAHVLCFDGSPAPQGVAGELVLAGPALAAGYLNDPIATQKAFAPHASDPEAARLYRTGDRAYWDGQGQLHFLGRRDRQVKLRGQRLELDGIEAVIRQASGVRLAAVSVWGAGTPGARLIAHIEGEGPLSPDHPDHARALAALEASLSQRLPLAAMPELAPLERLPQTAGGKVDRRALAALAPPMRRGPASLAPAPLAGSPPGPFVDPALRQFVEDFLDQRDIPPDQDLRDLGLTSISALQLLSGLEARFGHTATAADLYREATLAGLSGLIIAGQTMGNLIPIQPLGEGIPFFAVHVLGEKEALYRPLAAALAGSIPVYGLCIGSPLRPSQITVEAIAERYFADIQEQFPTGPLSFGAVSLAAYFAYDLAARLIAAGRDVRFVAVFDATGPGGRVPRRGLDRLATHLTAFLRQPRRHLQRVYHSKQAHRQFEAELMAVPDPDLVTGATLVAANARAVEEYQAKPISCPILVFRAADSFWDGEEARASALGWRPVAAGGLAMIDVPGDHLSILQEPNVQRIATCFRAQGAAAAGGKTLGR